jgi:GNAT superfamily N-acetyltransferase
MPSPNNLEIHPVTPDRLADLADLFGTSKTTTGCYCMWFLLPGKQCDDGWGETNRRSFEARVQTSAEPLGLVGYLDGEAVGWCAAGPLTRYERALRSPVLKGSAGPSGRDPAQEPGVWLVPCFFVRRTARKQGITRALLTAAVELARDHGAPAVQGFPLAGDRRRGASDAYLGAEPVFASCGFEVVSRPSASRVVMRRELSRA